MSAISYSCGSLDPKINDEFRFLGNASGRMTVEYVWIGGTGIDLRSKTRVLDLDSADIKVEEIPIWNYDGSSTAQAPGHDSEVLLKPVRLFKDPFRGGNNLLALCETHKPLDDIVKKMEPLHIAEAGNEFGSAGGNSRSVAAAIFENPIVRDAHPWYGLEQEYTLFESDKITPLGWPKGGFPGPQGPYYCSAGTENSFGRDIMEAHLQACLFAGVKIAGTNAEVMPGQWEYQIGPCEGLEAGDHLIVSRYLMQRVCEKYGVVVSFHPKPIVLGDWNGAGCHANFSTAEMRSAACTYKYTPKTGDFAGKELSGGFAKIVEAIERLGAKHSEHIAVYGKHNELRLTGKHETASIAMFKYGVANRGASIRIPRDTYHQGYGYFEDRRPASNMDPYAVTAKIAKTTILNV